MKEREWSLMHLSFKPATYWVNISLASFQIVCLNWSSSTMSFIIVSLLLSGGLDSSKKLTFFVVFFLTNKSGLINSSYSSYLFFSFFIFLHAILSISISRCLCIANGYLIASSSKSKHRSLMCFSGGLFILVFSTLIELSLKLLLTEDSLSSFCYCPIL